jgi:hypothetical protein
MGGLTSRATVRAVSSSKMSFNAVKIFSATMFADRDQLGDKVTAWMAQKPGREVADIVVTQSSDSQFHCIAVSVFYRE